MTKQIYDPTIVRNLTGGVAGIDWAGWTIRCAALGTGYTFSAAHADFTSISAHVLEEQTVASKSQSAKAIFGTVPNFTTVGVGVTVKGFVFFRETGVAATEFLLWYDDTVTLLPFVSVGTPIAVAWGSNKMFEYT